MADYIRNPITMRQTDNGFTVRQDGNVVNVNGHTASLTLAKDILADPRHSFRKFLGPVMARLTSGEIVAIVSYQAWHDKPVNRILLTREQYEAGAGERARWATWVAECRAAEKSRKAAERQFDRGMNEGGEGYNPYRHGSRRTYR